MIPLRLVSEEKTVEQLPPTRRIPRSPYGWAGGAPMLCATCGKRPRAPGGLDCEGCAERHAESEGAA